MKRYVVALVATASAMAGRPSLAQDMPPLVAAYTRQLAQQCGPLPQGAAAPALAERVDLNGDKLDDWIVDAGRYPCAGRPALAAAAGAQVTVFKGVQAGLAVPAFQRATFGSRLQKRPDGAPVLWLTLGGSDCGSDNPADRCDRQVVWSGAQRFDVVEPAKAAPKRKAP
jgi:hypothetical protein